jgi:hypothetical protein
MRQIGYRQEAGRLGAIGSCGRELCCSTWLTDFKLVNTSAARYQNLSLNPLKLSGQCGKLKCCLNYELESYVEALKDFPNENVVTLHFAEEKSFRSVKTDILKKLMWFAPQTELGGEWLSLPVKKVTEFMEMNRRGEKPTLEIQIKVPLKTEKVELEFKNDMGVGSLSRLDERDRNKKNQGRNKNNKTRSNNNAGNSNPVGNNPGASTSNNQTPRPNQGPRNNQGPRPNGPRPEGNNRPNNNAPRTEGNNPNNRPNTNGPQQGNAPRPEGNNNPNNRPNTNGPQQGNTPRPEGNNPNNRPPRRPNNNQNRNNRPNNNPNNNQSTNNNPTE